MNEIGDPGVDTPKVKPRKPRAKKAAPPKRHKAMITAVSALVISLVDVFLTVRYGWKLF